MNSSLLRLTLTLRRAAWTKTEISRMCSNVPAKDVTAAIEQADSTLGTKALVAKVRDDLEPLYLLRKSMAAHLETEDAMLAKLRAC